MGEGGIRSVLVTGSGSGIGAAVARRLAGPGIGLLLHARENRSGCERLAVELEALGAKTEIALGDLATAGVAARLVEQAAGAFGGLDLLVANAGFPLHKTLAELSRDELERCHAAMTGGFLELAQAALPPLKAASAGRVIAISSFTAHVFRASLPPFPASSAAKAGLEVLVKALALELAPHGVTVNAVAPGLIEKDQPAGSSLDPAAQARLIANVPLGRMGLPAEVAALVAFLAGPEAGYITGQVIHVNGGMT